MSLKLRNHLFNLTSQLVYSGEPLCPRWATTPTLHVSECWPNTAQQEPSPEKPSSGVLCSAPVFEVLGTKSRAMHFMGKFSPVHHIFTPPETCIPTVTAGADS